MKVCVLGLWHQGSVIAGCLAGAGNDVVGLDFDPGLVRGLQAGEPPIFEPDLAPLIARGLGERRLRFTTDPSEAASDVDVLWVAFDTPVDAHDRANSEWVMRRACRVFPHLKSDSLVLISSQLPVGSTSELERGHRADFPAKPVGFAYMAENLRVGQAINSFVKPERAVVGIRREADKERLTALLGQFTDRVEWMSVESAEMTKHALNAFLATSVSFINEIASLCELVGADGRDVERGLRSDGRVGPKAYVTPGAAFAGGTLARDLTYLRRIGFVKRQPTHLLSGVQKSNSAHKQWAYRRLESLLGGVAGRTVAVWGLTYKPGTSTLRRSGAVELCESLVDRGAIVQAHDPGIDVLPTELAAQIRLSQTPLGALANASALVVATPWPEYAALSAESIVAGLGSPVVLDASGFLTTTLGNDTRIRYVTVGRSVA